MERITERIKLLLGDRARVSCGNGTINICPPATNRLVIGYFLEHIRDVGWNDIDIPKDIKINLDGWMIDVDDHRFGHDIWCLDWMKEKYNVVDNCRRWREVSIDD